MPSDEHARPDSPSRDTDRKAREEMDALAQQAEEDLAVLDHHSLVRKYLDLQRAYVSALNAVMLFKRQLTALRDHTLKTGQIADLSRKVNIADIDIISGVAIRDVPLFFEAEFGALFLYDAETRMLTLHDAWPERVAQPPLHLENDQDTLPVHFLRTAREPMTIQGKEDYERRSGIDLRDVPADRPLDRGALLCPLFIGMQSRTKMHVGVLAIAGKPRGFTQHDADMATMMSEMLATAISTSRLIEQMSHLAETDGLTQLYNHRHFQQELDRAIASATRYDTPLSLAMIDIDHFKRFNDTYGHQAGDHVLQEAAHRIRMALRDQVDIPARYGGEEFAVVFPNTNLDGARVACERIREAIESVPIQLGRERVTLTVSAGTSQYAPGESKGELIERADTALYQAKRGGRNRVVAG